MHVRDRAMKCSSYWLIFKSFQTSEAVYCFLGADYSLIADTLLGPIEIWLGETKKSSYEVVDRWNPQFSALINRLFCRSQILTVHLLVWDEILGIKEYVIQIDVHKISSQVQGGIMGQHGLILGWMATPFIHSGPLNGVFYSSPSLSLWGVRCSETRV